MKAAARATLARGFEAPSTAAQGAFRTLLEAMSRPGRVQRLPAHALRGMEPPEVDPALCALLLTLLDAQTTLHIGPGLPRQALSPYLRFHTGVRLLDAPGQADFVALGAAPAAQLWQTLRGGTDEAPEQGATLIVQVPALACAPLPGALLLRLHGPGIQHVQPLAVGGIDAAFWRARIDPEAQFPRGVDLVLCCGADIAGVPRSTHLAVQG